MPVRFGAGGAGTEISEKPACHHLLEGFVAAGVAKAILVIREGKWDIPECLAAEPVSGIDVSYVVTAKTGGVPWTLDRAYPFVRDTNVILGYPDVLVRPADFYERMVTKLRTDGADVVLGVVPTQMPGRVDVVQIEGDDRIVDIQPKPEGLTEGLAWIAAAWRPTFTEFLHEYLSGTSEDAESQSELQVGDILAASMTELDIRAALCDHGRFTDIGTPEDLAAVSAAGADPSR